MNWYWLNVPLCIAIATAVVAPIMVVISREQLGDDSADLAAIETTIFAPAAERELVLV